MIKDDVQKQDGGDYSTNVQGKQIVVYQGISYADARDIALDVYKANFVKLSEDAATTAMRRAEELTDAFLGKLKEETPDAIETMREPGMQMALFTAQKEYARTGDKDLESLLVDILAERARHCERTIQQIVLDESLAVASKLTVEQLSALTVNFLISSTRNESLLSLGKLLKYIDSQLMPFVADLSKERTCYEHLAYTGCVSLIHISNLYPIEKFFNLIYPGLFSKGFEKERLDKEFGQDPPPAFFLRECLHDPEKLQVDAFDVETLKKLCKQKNVPEEMAKKLVGLFESTRMSDNDVRKYLIESRPALNHLFDVWESSLLSKFELTTVGYAIAQANLRRKTGTRLELSIWVK